MLSAFALVGGCTTFAIVGFNLARYENDARNELLTLAKVVSLQLSPEDQVRLSPADKRAYRTQDTRLIHIQRQAGNIRRIFTTRKGESGGYDTVLDTSIDPSKPLPPSIFHSTPGLDREAKTVFDSGVASVDDDIIQDRRGPYFTAYAPIVDSTGHVVAVLGIDRDAGEITSHIEALKREALISLGIVLLLGSIFSLIIVRQLARSSASEPWLRGGQTAAKIFRATILELALAGLAIAVLAMGVYSQIHTSQLRAEETASLDRSRTLDQYRSRIEIVLRDRKADPAGLAILAESASKEGMEWLATNLTVGGTAAGSQWQEPLWQSLTAIKRNVETERLHRERIHIEMRDMNERMTSALALAIILSFGSLILLRSAAKQEQALLIARHDSQRHQVAYEQVATNLPIGFYTFRDGEILDSNAMWDSMVTRQSGEERMMAIERTVEADELPRLITAWKTSQVSGESFNLQFKMRTSSSEARHFETRGLWLYKPEEGIDHLLGFFVDISDLVEVQEQLESRNREVQAKNFMLSRALSDLEENLEAMVRGLVKAVEAKDPYTAGHSERVMRYSMLIGEAMGLNANQLRILERGTLIHDVGKIGIPDAVLNKPAKLTDEEFAIIKSHPVIGAKMVRGIPVFEDCVPIIEWHHERLDGKGYPDGLAGDEIPDLVRIASVSDVFDALTSTRAYRRAMDFDEAIAILRKDAEAGILDRKIVEVLADIVKREGILWNRKQDAAA